MNIFSKNSILLCATIFSSVNVGFAGQNYTIHLQINTDETTQRYIKNICLTTNNGFTKSCGDMAKRETSSSSKYWKVTTFNLRGLPLGADNSCYQYRFNYNAFPSNPNSMTLHTTLIYNVSNHIGMLTLTDCKVT